MEELLKAILLASLPETEQEKIEPVNLSFKKQPGKNGEITTEINGTVTGVIAGCVFLLLKVVIATSPKCKIAQRETLEMIYTMVAEKLQLK